MWTPTRARDELAITPEYKAEVVALVGEEVTLETWQRFAEADPLTPRAVEQMVLGVSTRKYVLATLEIEDDAKHLVRRGELDRAGGDLLLRRSRFHQRSSKFVDVGTPPSFFPFVGESGARARGSAYPLLLGKRMSKFQSKRVTLVTAPCYAIVFTMLGGAAWAAFAR